MSKSNNQNRSNSSKPNSKPQSNRGNGNKPNSKPDRGNSFDTFNKGNRTNDPNWYFQSKELAEQAMNYSFETIMGSEAIEGSEYLPYVAVIALNPSPGTTYFCNDPGVETAGINVPNPNDVVEGYDGANYMASRMYTLLSAASGRNAQYQANDILMSILANSSIIEAIESLRRFFGMAFIYSQYNRALPKRIIEAMGLDFDDFVAHIDDYREALNFEISRFNQIPILSNIGFLRKSLELYQNIYVDEDSPYAQYFCYVPATVWKLDEQSYQNGSNLLTESWLSSESTFSATTQYLPISTNALVSMSTLIGKIRLMINEVLNSTTLNLVYMDLLHLAGKDSSVSFIKLDHILKDYVVLPKLDKTACLQFHNLNELNHTFYATRPATGSASITAAMNSTTLLATPRNDVASDPNTGRIIYNPCMLDDAMDRSMAVVDFFESNPSLEDRIEAQRYTMVKSNYHTTIGSGTTQWSILNIVPDHYPVFMSLEGATQTTYDAGTSSIKISPQTHFTVNNLFQYITWNAATVNDLRSYYIASQNIWELTKFKYHPVVALYDVASKVRVNSLGDYSYYTKLPFYKMKRINQYVYAGLFEFR